MVKRRKTSGTSGSRLQAEIKEERSPSADDVLLARDRLKGLLQRQGRRDHGDESSDSGHDDRNANDTPVHPPQRRPANIVRKRKRTDVNREVAFHHTYVMKLFDRSVDLAQFRENTPLYPICRAWMANQPCGPLQNLAPPKIKEDPDAEDDKMDDSLNDDNDLSSDPDSDLVKTTYKMPPPIPLTPSFERFPKAQPVITDAIKNLDFDDPHPPSKESLLQEHIQRWVNVRSEWIAACMRNEDRYEQSGRILRAIYKRAQKAFET